MQYAAICLALAAVGGVVMTVIRLHGASRPPTWLALGHGAIAACGLVLLIRAVATMPVPQTAFFALGFFGLAALAGGFIFGFYHLRERPLPIPLILGHGVVAATAFVLLLISLYS